MGLHCNGGSVVQRIGLAVVLCTILAVLGTAASASGESGRPAAKTNLPLYFGFFPADKATEVGLKDLALQTLLTALDISEVRRLYCQFTNQSQDTPIANLTSFIYANPTEELHVTSFYCNYGAVPSCADYAARPEVRAAQVGRFNISVTAVLLTPRTFGYRAVLGQDALAVWANGEGEAAPGQRAHFTVATSPGVSAVQTGLDLLGVANRVGDAVPDPTGRLRVLHFQRADFLLLLERPVPVVFRASDSGGDGGGGVGGLRPTAWLPLVAAAAWRALRNAVSLLVIGG